jgi:sugar lactone lactonase YvrE
MSEVGGVWELLSVELGDGLSAGADVALSGECLVAMRRFNRHRFVGGASCYTEVARATKFRGRFSKSVSRLAALTLALAMVSAGCGSGSNGPPTQPVVGLWEANFNNVLEFLETNIMHNGNSAPELMGNLPTPGFGAPQGVTFDSNGDLWVLDGGTLTTGGTIPPTVDEFTTGQLPTLTNSGITPNAVIGSADFGFPQQLVFDSSGNLWVSDAANNKVFEFTTGQLSGGANVTPTLVLTSTPAFNGSLGIAFDSSRDLWIANNNLSGASATVFEFSASQLSGLSGAHTLVPAAILQSNGTSISLPWALAFDSNGNLWVSNQDGTINTVVQFSKAQLAALTPAPTTPTPTVTISSTGSGATMTIDAPTGLAIDPQNDLAVSNVNNSISFFSFGQLTKSGSPSPEVFVAGSNTTINVPEGLVFGGAWAPVP